MSIEKKILIPENLHEYIPELERNREMMSNSESYFKVVCLCYLIIGLLKFKKRNELAKEYIFKTYQEIYGDTRLSLFENHNLKQVLNELLPERLFYDENGVCYGRITPELIQAFKQGQTIHFVYGKDDSKKKPFLPFDHENQVKHRDFKALVDRINDHKLFKATPIFNDPEQLTIEIEYNCQQVINNHYINKALRILKRKGLIEKLNGKNYSYSYKKTDLVFIPNQYALTEEGHELFEEAEDFVVKVIPDLIGDLNLNSAYKASSDQEYADALKNKEIDDLILRNKNNIKKRFDKWWKQVLPSGNKEYEDEIDKYIDALQGLEDRQYFLARIAAYQDGVWKDEDKLGNLPARKFFIQYYPLKSGRLQPNPHVYGSKLLRPYLRPANDIALKRGSLISLDFSKQELRLLTYFSEDPLLLELCKEDNFFDELLEAVGATDFEEYLVELGVDKIKQHKKAAMYSYIYGSDGYNLSNELYKEFIEQFDWDSCIEEERKEQLSKRGKQYHRAARDFIEKLESRLDSVRELRAVKAKEFEEQGYIEAPGGVRRYEQNDDKRTGSKDYYRTKSLSHYIQGAGAYIARKIILEANKDSRYQMHLPVHDGFIYYVWNDHDLDLVKSDIMSMMERCAREVIKKDYDGETSMPISEEWRIQ